MVRNVLSVVMLLAATFNAISASDSSLRNEGESDWKYIGFIEPGTKWEVEVKGVDVSELPVTNVVQWLDGVEEINGKEYVKLWVKINDGEYDLASYIRIDNAEMEIYALSPDDMERGERRIYDFRPHTGYRTLAAINWDGTLSAEDYIYHVDKHVAGGFESCGNDFSAWEVSIYSGSEDGEKIPLGDVTWIYGIGSPAGFLNQCYSINDGITSTLKRVETECSGVVYENNIAGITSVVAPEIINGIKYRPDGTLFRDGDKGIYIMNGKKYVQR